MRGSRTNRRNERRRRVLLTLGLWLMAGAPARADGTTPQPAPPTGAVDAAAAPDAPSKPPSADAAPPPDPSPPPSAAPPPADSPPDAAASSAAAAPSSLKALTETGVRLYEQGDFAGAIQAFTLGYSLRPKPLFLFNIAQAYRKSGNDQTALEFYQRFIQIDPHSPYRAEADAYIAFLRGKLYPVAAPPAPPRPPPRPVYKKGWFWGVLTTSAAVTGIAVTLGIVLGTKDPVTTLGTVEPRFR